MAAALFLWVVLGGLAGSFAKSVFWYESDQGWVPCILFGVVGGIAAASLRGAANAFQLSSMGLAVLGAAIVLSIYGLFAGRSQARKFTDRRAA